MKRFMALIGFTYLSGLVLATYFFKGFELTACLVFAVLFILSLVLKNTRKKLTLPIALLTVLVSLCSYCIYSHFILEPMSVLADKDAVISGKICELPYKSYNRYYYTIKTDKIDIDKAPQNLKIRLSMSKALDADVFDQITGKVHLFSPSDEGTFSSKNYYSSKGIHMFSYLYEYEDYSTEAISQKPLYYYFLKMRQALIEAIRTLLPEDQAAVATGILLGEKYLLGQDIKSDFRDIGVSHLLAVSGLHTSFIAYFLMFILCAFKLPKKWAARFSCLGILCFMALTGFVPSAVRSGIMMIIYFLGLSFGKDADSLNSLGISVFIISALNPLAAGDVGFLLSFAATLGIVVLARKLDTHIKNKATTFNFGSKFITKISSSTSVTVSATLFTLPIIVLCYKRVSLISVVANLILVTPSMIITITALIAAILFYIGPLSFLSPFVALICGVAVNFVTFCAGILAKFPFASVSTSQPFIKFCLASSLFLLALALFLSKGTQLVNFSLILSCIVLFVGILSYQICMRNLTQLAILDVGNGCSAVLTKNNRASVLSCGGDKIKSSKIRNYLQSKDISKLDFLVLSDYSDESALYAQSVVDEFSPYYVILPDDKSIDEKLCRSISDSSKICYYNNLAQISFGDNVNIKTIKERDNGYLHVKINDTYTLIYPACKNSYSIEDSCRDCGLFIFSKVPPNQYGMNCCYSIISSDLDNAKEAIYGAVRSKKIPISTAGDGDIVIDFPSSNKVCIRRVL